MTRDELFQAIQDGAGLSSREEAVRTVDRLLPLLADQVSGGAIDKLAAELPVELRGLLAQVDRQADAATLDDLIAQVQERLGVDAGEASNRLQALVRALVDGISPEAVNAVRAQLPYAMTSLFAADTAEDARVASAREAAQDPEG